MFSQKKNLIKKKGFSHKKMKSQKNLVTKNLYSQKKF